MQTFVLDFETYYDKEYTLKKMTPVEYVLDPRFEATGVAVKRAGSTTPAVWIDGPDITKLFARMNPDDTCLVTYNALFDMCIVSWIYGFVPKVVIDAMGIARAKLSHQLKHIDLKTVAIHLGLPLKGAVLGKVIGMTGKDIRADPILYEEYMNYGIRDAELCDGVFQKLVVEGKYPLEELAIMDMVIRATILPMFQLDQNVLAEHAHQIKQAKSQLMAQAMLGSNLGSKSDLMSNDKFAAMLTALGVDPPTKISPTTNQPCYAFAKSDLEFIDLEEHPDPRVQALVAARLGFKSTLEETRTERMQSISRLTWPLTSKVSLPNISDPHAGGWMPMPMRYSGAHTHRFSGDWKLNVQNLPKLSAGQPGKLRSALMAPEGYSVIAVDASQIEARIVAWLCGQKDLVELFATGADVYCNFGTKVFGRVITKADKSERFTSKQAVLGLGYGLGWVKFQLRLKQVSYDQTGTMITLSDEEAARVVSIYRQANDQIPKTWKALNNGAIPILARGGLWDFGPVRIKRGLIELPSGLELFYHNLHHESDEWWFSYAGVPKKLYGGKLLENITQALARIIVMDAAVRIRARLSRFHLQVHDELVYVVKDDQALALREIVLEEMARQPSWASDLPLAAEASKPAPSYGSAK